MSHVVGPLPCGNGPSSKTSPPQNQQFSSFPMLLTPVTSQVCSTKGSTKNYWQLLLKLKLTLLVGICVFHNSTMFIDDCFYQELGLLTGRQLKAPLQRQSFLYVTLTLQPLS